MAKYGKPPFYRTQWPVYAKQWDDMQVKATAREELDGFLHRALAGKDRYLHLQRRTAYENHNDGVPWWVSAIIAERESGQNWSRSLAQGDRWDRTSHNVPRGRGPFSSWEDAAIDALQLDGLSSLPPPGLSVLERALYLWERYNGWGYYFHNIPSPYVWGATSVQTRGKYTTDGKFDARAWDTQLGCAAMLRALIDADPTVRPIRES